MVALDRHDSRQCAVGQSVQADHPPCWSGWSRSGARGMVALTDCPALRGSLGALIVGCPFDGLSRDRGKVRGDFHHHGDLVGVMRAQERLEPLADCHMSRPHVHKPRWGIAVRVQLVTQALIVGLLALLEGLPTAALITSQACSNSFGSSPVAAVEPPCGARSVP